MSITPGWTVEQIREFVYEYECQPYGTKTAWLAGRGVSNHRLQRWRAAAFDGDLDKALVPREGGVMTEVTQRRRSAKVQAVREAAQEAEMARLQARVRELEATNEALGKAIGLLHAMNEHEPADAPITTDLSDS